ncbi:very short patch repair endonuclease [Azoarcus sp. L1K30]|uniref:very short patch repair endonuclease n=1 Tax=Azoarcus sp. L1K30 TaxID=2820277 RepID=UPI00201104FA|nr:very short patch repair endonuclease [Azoarcus sp. L1K30]
MMSGIRGKDTRIEVAVRKALFARGFRYLLNDGRLPGKPDMVFPKHRAVVFVHGCYWHGHDCALFRLPSNNREFWEAKIGANRVRDARTVLALRVKGWRVAVVWECALRGRGKPGLEEVTRQLDDWLPGDRGEITIQGGL